jgi:DNA modification methylase
VNLEIKQGDCLDVLKTLQSESINCCITSPPYWGLRDYGTGEWMGGDSACSHKRDSKQSELTQTGHRNLEGAVGDGIYKDKCKRCGAERKDRQIGLELTPESYVQKMVDVFREVKRVLRNDGTLWLNLGDSYSGSGKGPAGNLGGDERHLEEKHTKIIPEGLKQKDLVGIPWRVAFALQSDGWYLRQDIIWHKPNPMPESVTDRCTKAHEYIFLMAKSQRYYYDAEAIREPVAPATVERANYRWQRAQNGGGSKESMAGCDYANNDFGEMHVDLAGGRNRRSVWTVTTKPYSGAHFATFPKELIEPCVLAGCPKDGTILDPFGGSGTTAEVAIENGRNALLIELNPEYIELAKTRISNTQTNLFC